jgi:serine/threonine protein kinase
VRRSRCVSVTQSIRRHRERNEHLDERLVLCIAAQAAAALACLHSEGRLTHRDMKPHNLLLNSARNPTHVWLMDFGSVGPMVTEVATRTDALRVQERAAKFSSMAYRAPELWDAPCPGKVDVKADVWALGCVIYACMYGLSPFESQIPGGTPLAEFRGADTPAAGGALLSARRGRRVSSWAEPQACTHSRVLGAVKFPAEEVDPYSFGLKRLVMTCLDHDAALRPSAAEVEVTANELLRRDAASPRAITAQEEGAGSEFNPFATTD